MDAFGPGAAGHAAAGVFVDDHNFIAPPSRARAFADGDDVVALFEEEMFGAEGVEDEVLPALAAAAGDGRRVGFGEDFLKAFEAGIFPVEALALGFVFEIVAGVEADGEGVGPGVGPGERAGAGGTGDDEGGARLIDEDGIRLHR